MLHSILILDTWERGDAPEITQWVTSGFPFQEAPVSCFKRNAACPHVLFCLLPFLLMFLMLLFTQAPKGIEKTQGKEMLGGTVRWTEAQSLKLEFSR